MSPNDLRSSKASSSMAVPESYHSSFRKKNNNAEVKLQVRIQLLENESETLEESMYQLNEKIQALDEALKKVDSLIDERKWQNENKSLLNFGDRMGSSGSKDACTTTVSPKKGHRESPSKNESNNDLFGDIAKLSRESSYYVSG